MNCANAWPICGLITNSGGIAQRQGINPLIAQHGRQGDKRQAYQAVRVPAVKGLEQGDAQPLAFERPGAV